MMDSVFGEVRFDVGWYTDSEIGFRGRQYPIYVCANSYRESDFITDEQRGAYASYLKNRQAAAGEIEKLLIAYKGEDFPALLTPTGLVFERGGGYALLLDDETDPDNGIAVVLSPKQKVMTQDDYL